MATTGLKQYLLFSGSNYYPSGGIDDLVGDYDTIGEAIGAANEELLKGYNESMKAAFDIVHLVSVHIPIH